MDRPTATSSSGRVSWPLTALLVAWLFAGSAAAHPGPGTAASGVQFWQALLVVAVGGLLLGVAAVRLADSLPGHDTARSRAVVHLALLVVGGSLVVPLLSAASAAVGAGVAIGLLVGGLTPSGDSSASATAAVTTGGVFTHRAIEGVALAGIYASDSAVTLLGVGVLTGHAALEVAVVYATPVNAPRWRRWSAVLAAQAIPVATGAAGFALGTVSLPAQQGVVAVAGSALIAIGARGVLPARSE